MATAARSKWEILRAWAEGTPFAYDRAAALINCQERSLRCRAKREGWNLGEQKRGSIGDAHAQNYGANDVHKMRNRLWQRLDQVTDRAPDEAIEKAQLDGVQALFRVVDRLEQALVHQAPQARQDEGEPPPDLAQTLRALDERIQTISEARAHALMQDYLQRQRQSDELGKKPAN